MNKQVLRILEIYIYFFFLEKKYAFRRSLFFAFVSFPLLSPFFRLSLSLSLSLSPLLLCV